MLMIRLGHILMLALLGLMCEPRTFAQSYKYFRLGNTEDVVTTPKAGFALMGGGTDLDEAFRWLCNRGAGGDFLVLRARGDDDYNSYVKGLCKTNSVATLILPDRASAEEPRVADLLRHAEVIFIAGGDQANYINHWLNTPVQTEINNALARGVPIGGTSAGLAVLGEFIYSAQGDAPNDKDLSSEIALANPFHPRVTVRRGFLDIPILKNTLTDSHFKARNRMGRSLVFLARIVQDGWSQNPREIAVDEKNAVLVEPDGRATVVGSSFVYFMRISESPAVCKAGEPLSFSGIEVYRVSSKGTFDIARWAGAGGSAYTVSVERGNVSSHPDRSSIY